MRHPTPIALTTAQVLRVVQELDGIRVPLSTLAYWSRTIAPASVSHTGGSGPKAVRLYAPIDVARVRLAARLTALKVRGTRLRAIMTAIEIQLPELLAPRTDAVLRVSGWSVIVERPGRAAVRVPEGQLLLPLASVVFSEKDAQRFAAA